MTEASAASSTASAGGGAGVLVVDLDGTLIATDSLWESAMLLCRQRPLAALQMPIWLLAGKAHLKQRLGELVVPDAGKLPYRADVLEFIRQEKAAGRKIVLATASNQRIAQTVADHLGLFDAVLASDATTSLSGDAKLRKIQEQFCTGGESFDYIGDSQADVPVWGAAKQIYMVCPSARLIQAGCPAGRSPAAIFSPATSRTLPLLKALRPKQWIKNFLVMLPLLLAHKVTDWRRLQATLVAFLAFCLCASAIYIVNDLLDIEADRSHPRKRLRPFAAGTLPIPLGLMACASLIIVAFTLTALVNGNFALALLAYLVLTTGYSFYFKGKLLLDVILLAGLYTHRIIAGALAAEVPLTPWLLAFSMFLFISLAFAKRYSELTMLQLAKEREAKGRSYRVEDLEIILSVGPTSGYLAVLVFCLYLSDINSQAGKLYPHPQFLWLICPIFLYWITRVWFFARRHALVDDPIVFALRDRVSWMAVALTGLLVGLAVVG